jgi:hypothetical protein
MAKLGRPFVYQSEDDRPVTVSLRVPRDVYTRLQRYAVMHRLSITTLVLDGLALRLKNDDPRATADTLSYYDNTVLQELAQPAHLLDDRLPYDEDVQVAAPQVEVLQEAPHCPAFDSAKFFLGTLCRRRHEWGTTGQSLRRRNAARQCAECVRINIRNSRRRRTNR